MRAIRRPRERCLLAPRCYYFRSSQPVSWLCTPALSGTQAVCVMPGVPRDFWKFCPSKTSNGRSIQSHLSGGASSPAVTQATTTQRTKGTSKAGPLSPQRSTQYCISGSPFCSLTSERTIDRLCPSWPPSTSPRRSWRSSRDGGRSRLSRHKYALGLGHLS